MQRRFASGMVSRPRAAFAVLLTVFLALGDTGAARQLAPVAQPATDPRLLFVLAAEENRAAADQQLRDLAEATRAGAPVVQAAAARALGRLERRDVIPVLLPLLSARDEDVRREAANAIAQAFRGEPPAASTSADQLDAALEALLSAPRSDGLYRAIGRLPFERLDQLRAAEAYLLAALESSQPPASAARGLESLARLRPRLAALDDRTVERLRALAGRRSERTVAGHVRRNAMLALLAWQGADAATVEAALNDEEFEIRRLAALVMAGAGSMFSSEERAQHLAMALRDPAPQVRLEAIRTWARRAAADHGCTVLVSMLSDTDLHVVIAALDALGDQCGADEQVTDIVASEARTPPAQGAWQREAHAFLALAKRSPERAAVAMSSFAMHEDPYVRVYAVRAAAAMDDLDTLRRLAADPDDNVVEAALPPLRRRLGAASDALFITALDRRTRTVGRNTPARPYQVYRIAARELKGAAPTNGLLEALAGALVRVSGERCETSRDARLELVARIVEFGSRDHASVLTPLLRDLDPKVAGAAADGLAAWTGRRPAIQPPVRQPELPPSLPSGTLFARVQMESGRVFRMAFYADQAPLTWHRFTRLVRERYYNGLPFHRVVQNFVIQGGSPNANEYCGDCRFMRDEVGLRMNVRGTVGVSTRGRDTGDAQFFVNLVDTPRLDHEYTVFGYVCPGDMAVVDRIHEGDRMWSVVMARQQVDCPPPE